MELFIVIALVVLAFMAWQLWRAKQFNCFKGYVVEQLKPRVLAHVEDTLLAQRCDVFPNTETHIKASQYYWGQYPSRVLQYALTHELLSKELLESEGNYRYCQHLFHVEQDKLH